MKYAEIMEQTRKLRLPAQKHANSYGCTCAIVVMDEGNDQAVSIRTLDYCENDPEFEAFDGEIIELVEPNRNITIILRALSYVYSNLDDLNACFEEYGNPITEKEINEIVSELDDKNIFITG